MPPGRGVDDVTMTVPEDNDYYPGRCFDDVTVIVIYAPVGL